MPPKPITDNITTDAAELRREAERRLSERKRKAAPSPRTETDTQRLVHELEVHQIELEMQNEELMQARTEMETALDQYTDLYDFAPVGYFTLTRDGTIQKTNLAGANLLKMERSKLIERRFGQFVSVESRPVFNTLLEKMFSMNGNEETCETELLKDGNEAMWVRLDAKCSVDERVCQVMALDITERKQAETKLAYQANLLANVNDAVIASDERYFITSWNRAAEAIYGWKEEEVIGRHEQEFLRTEFLNESQADIARALSETGHYRGEWLQYCKDGQQIYIETTVITLLDENNTLTGFVGVNRDITKRKQVEETLRVSQQNYARLVDSIDGIVWEAAAQTFQFSFVSKQAERLLGYPTERWIMEPTFWEDHIHPDDQRWVVGYCIASTREKRAHDFEYRMISVDNQIVWLRDIVTVVVEDGQPVRLRGVMVDITERKRAENEIRRLKEFDENLINNMGEGIMVQNTEGFFTFVNPAASEITGYLPEELLGAHWTKFIPADQHDLIKGADNLRLSGESSKYEIDFLHKTGRRINMLVSGSALFENEIFNGSMAVFIDITDRKQTENALRASEDFRRLIVDTEPECVKLIAPDGGLMEMNSAGLAMIEADTFEQVKGKSMNQIVAAEYRASFSNLHKRVMSGESGTLEFEIIGLKGTRRWLETHAVPFRNQSNQIEALLGVTRDITERNRAENEIRQRLNELEILYQSGLTLNQLVHPKAIAQKVIDLLDQKMDWHHTAIRLYHPESETFELLAFNLLDFHKDEQDSALEERFETAVSRIGQGLSGWAVQHGEAVRSNDLKNDPRYVDTFPGSRSGLYVPIKIAKKVIGVISIESKQADAFTESDEMFTTTLVSQAAIAMDNAQLLESLQRSNLDLGLAYDTTIEGWSHALDLRDKETEGHTQRVTQLTEQLARAMGIPEAEIIHIRRGALLHDMGKLGIPDRILLKSDKLTDDEWAIMKKHPQYAYDMLSPIHYLHPALDIPYCHHEKWDGTGYPRGLKGEQIPLAARLFAVVDVWDALRSDRPYRLGWPSEKVLEHICSLDGTHFDPQAVQIFLRVVGENAEAHEEAG